MLTDITLRTVKAREKPYKLADERGLYVLVTKTSKAFRFDYRFEGKRKTLSFGIYPDVSLRDAREKRDKARSLLAKEIDPGAEKKAAKSAKIEARENCLENIAREWYAKFSTKWSASHSEKIIRRLEKDIFPLIGNRPVAEITAPELLQVLRKIESRGATELVHRILQYLGQIFRYAIATGRAVRDPSGDLKGALTPVKVKHRAAIVDSKGASGLLRAIDDYQGAPITAYALQLAPYLFLRPGELRSLEWPEIDFDRGEIRIPAAKMKMNSPHVVPLSMQAIEILKKIHPLTAFCSSYVFPSIRSDKRPMSENTINAALRRLGYTKEEMTGHGFRSMASTMLNESGKWSPDTIERQLAHAERNGVRAAYNHAEYMDERRRMMQWWADYLDSLKNSLI